MASSKESYGHTQHTREHAETGGDAGPNSQSSLYTSSEDDSEQELAIQPRTELAPSPLSAVPPPLREVPPPVPAPHCHTARLAKQRIIQVKMMNFALFRHWPAHPPRVEHCWGRHRHRRPSGRGGARAQSGEEGRRGEATSCPTCGEQLSCGRRCSRLALLRSALGTHGTRGGRADSERWQGKPSCSAP